MQTVFPMAELEIIVERHFVEDTPEEIEARRQRIIKILRRYRHHLLDSIGPDDSDMSAEAPEETGNAED